MSKRNKPLLSDITKAEEEQPKEDSPLLSRTELVDFMKYTKRQGNTPPIMDYFEYSHLPPRLAAISKLFHNAAWLTLTIDGQEGEVGVALRKLLEAKDAAVRAAVSKMREEADNDPVRR